MIWKCEVSERDALLREATVAGVRARVQEYPWQDANRALADLKYGQVTGTGVLSFSS